MKFYQVDIVDGRTSYDHKSSPGVYGSGELKSCLALQRLEIILANKIDGPKCKKKKRLSGLQPGEAQTCLLCFKY